MTSRCRDMLVEGIHQAAIPTYPHCWNSLQLPSDIIAQPVRTLELSPQEPDIGAADAPRYAFGKLSGQR